MKPSKYNYIIEYGDRAIFFNGITELFFDIPIGNREKYEAILSSPDFYSDPFGSFIDRMKSCGFILDEETDEQELLEKKYANLCSESQYRLMILPTYQCNLRCWYCTQEHQDLSMTEDTLYEIRRLLENIARDPKIKRFQLSWFGGEPLLEYEMVCSLTNYCKEMCEANETEFQCDITTNATLLDCVKIEELSKAGIGHYQITIDGRKDVHDRIKVLGKSSAFDKCLKNVNMIARTTPCTLRFNYTHDNLNPTGIVEDLKTRIKPESRANIRFMIYKVWQENAENIDFCEVEKLASLSAQEGICPELPTIGLCYADSKNFNCIFPNGMVEKCDNESPNSARGKLSNGKIIWDKDIPAHIPAHKNSSFPCRECRYLPVCWGPCVAKRDRMIREKGNGCCQYENKDLEMRQICINRFINVKNGQLLNS